MAGCRDSSRSCPECIGVEVGEEADARSQTGQFSLGYDPGRIWQDHARGSPASDSDLART